MTATTVFQITAAGEAEITALLLSRWTPAIRDGVDADMVSSFSDDVLEALNRNGEPCFEMSGLYTVSGSPEVFTLSNQSYEEETVEIDD